MFEMFVRMFDPNQRPYRKVNENQPPPLVDEAAHNQDDDDDIQMVQDDDDDDDDGDNNFAMEPKGMDESMFLSELERLQYNEQCYLEERMRRGILVGHDPVWDWRLMTMSGSPRVHHHDTTTTTTTYDEQQPEHISLRALRESHLTDAIDLPEFTQLGAVMVLNEPYDELKTVQTRPVGAGAWEWIVELESGERKSMIVASVASEIFRFTLDLMRTAQFSDDLFIGRLHPREIAEFQCLLLKQNIIDRNVMLQEQNDDDNDDDDDDDDDGNSGCFRRQEEEDDDDESHKWFIPYVAQHYVPYGDGGDDGDDDDDDDDGKGASGPGVFKRVRMTLARKLMDAMSTPLTRFLNKRIYRMRNRYGANKKKDSLSSENDGGVPTGISMYADGGAPPSWQEEEDEEEEDGQEQYVWIKFPGILRLYELYVVSHEPSLLDIMECIREAASGGGDDDDALRRLSEAAKKLFDTRYPGSIRRNALRQDLVTEVSAVANALNIHFATHFVNHAAEETTTAAAAKGKEEEDKKKRKDGGRFGFTENDEVNAIDNKDALIQAAFDRSYVYFLKRMQQTLQEQKPEIHGELLRRIAPNMARVYALSQALAVSHDRVVKLNGYNNNDDDDDRGSVISDALREIGSRQGKEELG